MNSPQNTLDRLRFEYGDISSGANSGNGSQQRNATNNKPRPPLRKSIKIHYTNGDVYDGNVNATNLRDGYGTYICGDRKR